MWTCQICGAEIEDDSWERCWKCTAPRHLDAAEIEALKRAHAKRLDRVSRCLRCDSSMEYIGTKRFHEGPRVGVLGKLGELLLHREHYDVYHCEGCGKLEFYLHDPTHDADRFETAPESDDDDSP